MSEPMTDAPRATTWARAGVSGIVVGLLVAGVVGFGGAVVPAAPAEAADETTTSSAVTLTNTADALVPEGAPFPDLEVTVSQTKDLVSQGIRVDWRNGRPSSHPDQSQGGDNILQIAQCWGEDPDNPGHPDRRTCQYGGTLGAGAARDGFTQLENTAPEDLRYTADLGFYAYSGIPFVAVNGEGIVDEHLAPADRVVNNMTTDANGKVVRKPDSEIVDLGTNPFFTALTTNEVPWAGAGADGSGSVPFEVQTAMQSTGLGCGTPIPQADGTVVGQSCWLVVIPRGTGDSGSVSNNQSGLFWDAWEHHLAVELEFKPLGVRCELGAAERQLAGSELVAGAMGSWQPALCLGENGSPFVLSQGNEGDAVVKAAGTAPSPLAFTSRPLDLTRVADTTDPVAYAPVALSGVAISFSIDRQPHPIEAPDEYKARAGLPMTDLKLTPRLVAKLLTASYLESMPGKADIGHLGSNPRTLVFDPDFRAINDPEWSSQIIATASVSDMLLPSGRSDLAVRLWEYVLADPEARAWLHGEPDRWGMVVNPWYSTNAAVNPTTQGLALPVESFPKADPVEKPDTTESDPIDGGGPVNLVTHRPYTHSFADSAYHVLRGDGMILGDWDGLATPPKYRPRPRSLFGSQAVIGLTSAPAAELFQTVTAALRNPAGQYVVPTRESMAAAAAAMTPTPAQPKVLEFDATGASAKAAQTAYPLTMPVYAALNPGQSDGGLRAVYADLIRYAAGEGQVPGTEVGELPPGYAPLPQSWVDQALAAADAIEAGAFPSAPPTGGSAPAGSGGAAAPPRSTRLQPPSAPVAPGAADPTATGPAAGELVGAATPEDPALGVSAAAVPAGLLAGLGTALAVPLMSRIRRRS